MSSDSVIPLIGEKEVGTTFPPTPFSQVCFCTAEVGKQPGRQSKETVWGYTKNKEGNTYGCIFNTSVNCVIKSAVDRSRVLDNSTETEPINEDRKHKLYQKKCMCHACVYFQSLGLATLLGGSIFLTLLMGAWNALMITPVSMVIFSRDSSDLMNNEMICAPPPCSR